MGLLSKIKKALINTKEVNSTEESNLQRETNNREKIKYPALFNQCNNIFMMITKYECQQQEKEEIEFWRKLYEETGNGEYLKMFDEAKHNLFIKPPVIKELISIGRDNCGLSKELFYDEIENYFAIIATDQEFPPDFCFEYLKKEIETHYFYYPIKHIDFNEVINTCFINKNNGKIEESAERATNNRCPYCNEVQEGDLTRSKKCSYCGRKIYVLKVLDRKLYLNEKDYYGLKEEQEKNKSKLDFCYMILRCGVSEEELNNYLIEGNLNRVNDFAWRKLSEQRNRYFEVGQIDMLSKVNQNLAKILIYEKKYKTAIRFICESLYEDGSPISFHPGRQYEEVDGKIQNTYIHDTIIYNERFKPHLNEYTINLLLSLKGNFEESEFREEVKAAFEESSHFYLEKSPQEMFEEVKQALNL